MATYKIVSQWNLEQPLQVLSISSKFNSTQSKQTSVKKTSKFGLWLFLMIVVVSLWSFYNNENSNGKTNEFIKKEVSNIPISEQSQLNNDILNNQNQEIKGASKKPNTPKIIPSPVKNQPLQDTVFHEDEKSVEMKKNNQNEASKDLNSLKDL